MKKIVVLIASLLATNAMATMSSTTYVDQMLLKCAPNQWCEIFSKHDWSVSNDTPTSQTVSICYTTTGCADSSTEKKTMTTCDQVTLASMETKAGSKNQDLRTSFPYPGGCKIVGSTNITGWITQSSSREGRLYIN